MVKLIRYNNVIKGNMICRICGASFEFIDDINGEAVVDVINQVNGKDESMIFDITAKCNKCNYRAKYSGKLDL